MKKTLDKSFVECYSQKFEESKYPYEPYKKLVWGRIELNNKYSILGAWKTGCVKTKNGKENESFIIEGKQYYYTNRWKNSTPVKKLAWEQLNSINYKQKLLQLSNLKSFSKPDQYHDIIGVDGIGFIYTLFVLHCENPSLFPLYDQHVWRAYLYFTSEKYKSANAASQSWISFVSYAEWFKINLKVLGNIHPTELDRALWAFGKELKKK